jgi:hypothetical protein
LHNTKNRRPENRRMVANPKKEVEEEFLEGRKQFSLEQGEALLKKAANLGRVAILPESWAKI